jgi:mRNA interferase MazF
MTTKHKIVLVPFPFDDLSATKLRPVACLTNKIGPHGHVVVAFITSHIAENPLPTDIILDTRQPGFAMTGLRVPSTLQLHRLMTVTANLFQRDLGQLPLAMQLRVRSGLISLLGL